MKAFTKVVNPGAVLLYDNKREKKLCPVFVKIEYDGRVLSFTGVEGPRRNGDAWGSCGQICSHLKDLVVFAPGWDLGKVTRLAYIWNRWHLNDMHPYCKHQRDWDFEEILILTEFDPGPQFLTLQKKVKDGEATVKEYLEYQEVKPTVEETCYKRLRPKHVCLLSPEATRLLKEKYIQQGKTYKKAAGQVRPKEHPGGLLTKPCPVCGYRYGTEWLFEEVPEDVLEWLKNLPDTTVEPAWV